MTSETAAVRRRVEVALAERAYAIEIGCLADLGARLQGAGMSKAFLVTDKNVRALYADAAVRSVESAGLACRLITLPPGEQTKSIEEAVRLWDAMLEDGVDRRSAVVALGGGVVGDLAGFAAATVVRGVPFFQVPTTLLAQVDSSVGGKTGIDRPRGKNLVGAFWQPFGVLIDIGTLRTLPPRELRAGLAEVVKTGVIRSAELFDLIERNAEAAVACDGDVMAEAVYACCRIKADIVSRDERDVSGERAVLNYGHTIGHAVEAAAGFSRLLHGEAVAIGMVAAGRIALDMGLWDAVSHERVRSLLNRLGLPTGLAGLGLDREAIMRHLSADKKAVEGRVRFVLPERIGFASLVEEPVGADEIAAALEDIGG